MYAPTLQPLELVMMESSVTELTTAVLEHAPLMQVILVLLVGSVRIAAMSPLTTATSLLVPLAPLMEMGVLVISVTPLAPVRIWQ